MIGKMSVECRDSTGRVGPRKTPVHGIVTVEGVWASCGRNVSDALYVDN